MNQKQISFITLAEEKFGSNYNISKKELENFVRENDLPWPSWLLNDTYRVGRGMYKLPSLNNSVVENVIPMKKPEAKLSNVDLIPEKDPNFVPWGFYSDLKNIVKSKIFYPVFIYGESGFGKTVMVEQICADLKREMIKFNFSPETDIVSLMGGPTLINGNVEFNDGPVIQAMRKGAVLYMDELAKSHPGNILVLNGILEGKSYLNPHTGEVIKAADGFQVIASSNSNGLGDDSGRYIEQILDSSFLERFPITVIQEQPTEKIEIKILSQYSSDEDFIKNLVKWARVIRKSYEAGAINEIISIRRLVHILRAFDIFKDKIKAIELCTNRFDSHTRESFVDLYQKIDAGVNMYEDGITIIEDELVPDEL
jgi:hypothetical protein